MLAFPSNPDDMLLSGVLVGGQALASRAQVVDIPVGQGHVVSFAIRPFWRWQTQGTFFLGFNTILNWNDLDAGRPVSASDVDAVACSRHRDDDEPDPSRVEGDHERREGRRRHWGGHHWLFGGARAGAARRGVRVFEARTIGAGATQASAGILAPYIEGHDRGLLFELGVRSLALYDDFVRDCHPRSPA